MDRRFCNPESTHCGTRTKELSLLLLLSPSWNSSTTAPLQDDDVFLPRRSMLLPPPSTSLSFSLETTLSIIVALYPYPTQS